MTSLLLLRAVLAVEALLWRKEFGVASITEDCLDRGLLDSGSLYSRGRDKQGGRLLILSVRRLVRLMDRASRNSVSKVRQGSEDDAQEEGAVDLHVGEDREGRRGQDHHHL